MGDPEEEPIQLELSLKYQDARQAFQQAHDVITVRATGSLEGFNHLLREILGPISDLLSREQGDVRRGQQLLLYIFAALALESALLVDYLGRNLGRSKQDVLDEIRRMIEQRGHL